jgi:LmbE family N-acetylglucosaminyl deacetylase
VAVPTGSGLLGEVPPRALAVYAHPGDPEVSCGGTLARWAASGCEVMVVLVSAGDKGTRDPAVDPAELTRRRAAEAAESAAVLGVAELELLGHPDGALSGAAGLTAQLVGLVRRWKPSTVVCPDPTAVLFGDGYVNHADHRGVGWAALDAVAPAASLPLYFPDQGPPHEVGTMLLSGTLQPDVWVDVGGSVSAKSAAMRCHRSQLGTEGPAWVDDVVRGRLEEEGRRAGVRWAEGFRRVRLR